jgi:hypothetical protein
MYDDLNNIRHVFKIPVSYFQDLEDFGIEFLETCEYEIEDLMLDKKNFLTAPLVQKIVTIGKRIQ